MPSPRNSSPPRIHPTAIVADTVQLGPGADIGPGCILQGDIRLGPGTRLLAHACLRGPMSLGQNCTVYPHTTLGYAPQDTKFDPATEGPGLTIGDRCVIREGVSIHRGTKAATRIGHDCYLMASSHVAHDCVLGNGVTFANGVLPAGHVHVGDNAFLGGAACVHQFTRIGRLAIVSGMAPAKLDVPPFCLVYQKGFIASLNLVGLRRHGLRHHVKPLREAFDIAFNQRHTNPKAAELILHKLGDDPLCVEMAEFIQGTKRGLLEGPPQTPLGKARR